MCHAVTKAQEIRFWHSHPGLFTKRTGGWRLVVAETAVEAQDPEQAAHLVLRARLPLELHMRLPLGTLLRVPAGEGLSVAHPWTNAELRIHLDVLVDSFRRVSCSYPELCPMAWIPEPVPVHLGIRQASPDRGSLQLDRVFQINGGWSTTNTLVHVAKMCASVLLGSSAALLTVSGLSLEPKKLPTLLRLMESSIMPCRHRWIRRRIVVLWINVVACCVSQNDEALQPGQPPW